MDPVVEESAIQVREMRRSEHLDAGDVINASKL